jgi:glycosyltransferase involved in cell wall biosynthesis
MMMMERPDITVILPVYNRRHLIQRAIDSVFAQTFTDWELLIVDDGSSDGLESLVLPLVMRQAKLRYMKHANRKLSASRNIGMQAALGPYITFIDSDDAYKPGHLEKRITYMRAHPHVDLIHGGVVLFGPEESHYVEDVERPGELIHLSDCYIGATIFAKREAMIKSGGFRIMPYSAESELIPRMKASAFTIQRVDFPTYIYYTGLEDSICTKKKNNHF